MSAFLNNPAQPITNLQDWRAQEVQRDGDFSENAIAPAKFSGFWWGRSGLIGELVIDTRIMSPVWFDMPYPAPSGGASSFGFAGVTRDVNNTPVGGCTVKLFRTSDDLKIAEVVSDSSGNFALATPYYPDTHYIVCFKDGSPDIQGVSVNTLIGE